MQTIPSRPTTGNCRNGAPKIARPPSGRPWHTYQIDQTLGTATKSALTITNHRPDRRPRVSHAMTARHRYGAANQRGQIVRITSVVLSINTLNTCPFIRLVDERSGALATRLRRTVPPVVGSSVLLFPQSQQFGVIDPHGKIRFFCITILHVDQERAVEYEICWDRGADHL